MFFKSLFAMGVTLAFLNLGVLASPIGKSTATQSIAERQLQLDELTFETFFPFDCNKANDYANPHQTFSSVLLSLDVGVCTDVTKAPTSGLFTASGIFAEKFKVTVYEKAGCKGDDETVKVTKDNTNVCVEGVLDSHSSILFRSFIVEEL